MGSLLNYCCICKTVQVPSAFKFPAWSRANSSIRPSRASGARLHHESFMQSGPGRSNTLCIVQFGPPVHAVATVWSRGRHGSWPTRSAADRARGTGRDRVKGPCLQYHATACNSTLQQPATVPSNNLQQPATVPCNNLQKYLAITCNSLQQYPATACNRTLQ